MFLETERRALAGRSARDQRAGALFDLPVHKAREGGRIERPVAEWRHQGGNRTRKHVSLLYKDRAGPIESGRRAAIGRLFSAPQGVCYYDGRYDLAEIGRASCRERVCT